MLLYKQALLHSSLSAADTASMYLLASMTIIPVVRAENKTTRALHKIYSSVADWSKHSHTLLEAAMWHVSAAKGAEGLLTHGQDATALGQCPLVYSDGSQPCRLIAWQQVGFVVCR
jgi:hypothetical protein